MREIHDWFLQRGLPLVLTRRVRSRALIERSAPVVSGLGAVVALVMLLSDATGDRPDVGYEIRLAVLGLLLVAAPFLLNVLRQTGVTRTGAGRRAAAWTVIALFVVAMPITLSGWSADAVAQAPVFGLVASAAVWFTYLGIGSIALWALRFAVSQVGALGTLMSRALPLLMLTVVVFFTGELWQLSARTSRERLWQTIGFLAVVAIAFMVTTIRDEVRVLREDRSSGSDPALLLVDTPLYGLCADEPARSPLSRAEQLNVVAVMVVSQAIQVVLFTAGLFLFFLLLGIVAIPDDVTVLWSGEQTCAVDQPPCPGTWFGIGLPIPQTVVHMSLFVAVLSGLYFTVSTSVDPLYRQRFFEPLIADVAVSLAGRDAYLEAEGRE